jgi:hypothetical protein
LGQFLNVLVDYLGADEGGNDNNGYGGQYNGGIQGKLRFDSHASPPFLSLPDWTDCLTYRFLLITTLRKTFNPFK